MVKQYMSPWIFTTTNCNLKCPYCYVKQTNEYMTLETYLQINARFGEMLKSKQLDFVIYRLAGGEPLLTFDTWREPMMSFLKEFPEQSFVSILTNLTQLTDEMLDYFQQGTFGFGVSLDGFSYSKPYHNGVSSAETVKANIDRLLAKGLDCIDISTVIDKQSFLDIEELAHWIASRNLNWGIYLDHFFCGEMDTVEIVEKMYAVVDILKSYDYDILNKLKFNNIKINSKYEGCTAGEKLLAIDVKGQLFPCQTTIYDTPVGNVYDTEDIVAAFKTQKSYKLGYNYTLPSDCESCSIADICGGGCKQNNKEINRNYTCTIMKYVLLYMLQTVESEG